MTSPIEAARTDDSMRTQRQILDDAEICVRSYPGASGYAPQRDKFILAQGKVIDAARTLEDELSNSGDGVWSALYALQAALATFDAEFPIRSLKVEDVQ